MKKQKLAMASAEGGEQEGCGSQLAIPEDATVPHESQLAQDGAKQEQRQSQLAIPDCLQEELMPDHFTIGTRNAIRSKDVWSYTKKQLTSETIYVSDKGSKRARKGEKLVLRRVDGMWTAFDCVLTDDEKIHEQRQAVFRSHEADITCEGEHKWEMNYAASRHNNGGTDEVWRGTLRAITKYERNNDASSLEMTEVVDRQHQLR